MAWWILELITTIVLVAIVLVLGPLIKHFGRSYAADVFVANPRTGKSYLILMDIAYYLIFGAIVIFTIRFAPDTGWGDTVTADQLKWETVRIGLLLLLMGFLHGLNVITLPIIGRLLSLNQRLDEDIHAKAG